MINVEIQQSTLLTSLIVILVSLNTLFLLIAGGYALYRLRGPGFSPHISLISIRRYFSAAILGVIAFYGLFLVRDLLMPFLVAFFLASLLDPVVSNLEKRNIPRGRGVGVIFACVFMVITVGLAFVLPKAISEIRDLTSNITTYESEVLAFADNKYQHFHSTFQALGMKEPPSVWVKSKSVSTAAMTVLTSVKDSLLGFAGRILWIIIIPLSLYYFLLDYQVIRARFIGLLPTKSQANVDKISAEVVDIFSHYIRGLAKVCFLYGISAAVLCFAFGLNFALFLGVAAGFLYAVPYVGPALAIASAGIISLSGAKGTTHSVVVVICFLIMHFIFDYIVTPRMVGGSVGLHPLVNVLALMLGATYFGIWGMLLAVPVAASIQMVLLYFYPRLGAKPAAAVQDTEPILRRSMDNAEIVATTE